MLVRSSIPVRKCQDEELGLDQVQWSVEEVVTPLLLEGGLLKNFSEKLANLLAALIRRSGHAVDNRIVYDFLRCL
jgi:hypothetical protein